MAKCSNASFSAAWIRFQCKARKIYHENATDRLWSCPMRLPSLGRSWNWIKSIVQRSSQWRWSDCSEENVNYVKKHEELIVWIIFFAKSSTWKWQACRLSRVCSEKKEENRNGKRFYVWDFSHRRHERKIVIKDCKLSKLIIKKFSRKIWR